MPEATTEIRPSEGWVDLTGADMTGAVSLENQSASVTLLLRRGDAPPPAATGSGFRLLPGETMVLTSLGDLFVGASGNRLYGKAVGGLTVVRVEYA